MPDTTPTAQHIAEDLLARTGAGLTTGNFDLFGPCFAVPCQIETLNGLREISDIDALQRTFEDVVSYFKDTGVTMISRHVVCADFRGPDEIASTHEARIISNGQLIFAPYPVFSIIRRLDDMWKITLSQYVIVEADGLNRALEGNSKPASPPAPGSDPG